MADEHPAFNEECPERDIRLLSIVEAVTVTGPLKPLLVFSSTVRDGFQGRPPVRHRLITTRRPALDPGTDRLRLAAEAAGLTFVGIPERGRFDVNVLTRMYEAIKEAAPAIIETHDSKSHFLFYVLRIRHPPLRRCTWIAFHHGYTRVSWKVRLYQQLDRLSLRGANHLVTFCKPFASQLMRRGAQSQNISIISNFSAPRPRPPSAEIARARHEFCIGANERVIISIGRLSREKAQSDLIAAFGAMPTQQTQPVRVVFVGDGPDKEELRRLAAPFGDRVLFTGHLDDPWPLLSGADIFALSSHSEGSPLVIFEAMAAGLPIVATAVGGIPEVCRDGENALLVPPRNPQALATALGRLIDDVSLRTSLGKAAAATLAEFTPTAYASRLMDVYDLTLRGNAS